MHAYWAQWSHEEIQSMHGIEDNDTDLCHFETDTELCQDEEEDYLTLEMLGMSWKDFM